MKPHYLLKDSQGRFRTMSLFWEFRQSDFEPLYSIKGYDLEKGDKTFPSLKKIYLAYDHVPGFEYQFAMEVFGNWSHWAKLCNISQLRGDIKEWQEELDIKLKCESMKAMMLAAKDNDAKGVSAAKYLAEKGYQKKAGRPSKEEVAREIKIAAGVKQELQDDMERIGLKVMEGGK
jgi:hypothetical protein